MLFVLFMLYAVLGAVVGILGLGKAPKPAEPVLTAGEGDDLHEEIEEEEPAK
jgi:hypothetical protein